jgi:DNA-binding protein HU-beta
MAKLMSKSELLQKIAEQHANNMTRKDVKGVIESLAEIGHKELKKTGAFFVPGFAKLIVIKKPATKARKGINPFTKEPTIFKAKPARKIIKARPVKAVPLVHLDRNIHRFHNRRTHPRTMGCRRVLLHIGVVQRHRCACRVVDRVQARN